MCVQTGVCLSKCRSSLKQLVYCFSGRVCTNRQARIWQPVDCRNRTKTEPESNAQVLIVSAGNTLFSGKPVCINRRLVRLNERRKHGLNVHTTKFTINCSYHRLRLCAAFIFLFCLHSSSSYLFSPALRAPYQEFHPFRIVFQNGLLE